jgi:CxxC-x17-CxxC domain-containing protein
MYTDETLTCTDCGASFTFSANEQEFYASKGFTNKPNRCPDCRAARKAQRGGGGYENRGSYGGGGRAPRQMFQATCTSCGKVAEVPFEPTTGKPVYCRDCFSQRRNSYR